MKLYVWPYAEIKYHSGLIAVVAENKEAAIEAILKVYPGDKYATNSVMREPDVYESGEVIFWEGDC